MPFDDEGVFTRVANSFSNPVAGTLISPADADAYFDDLDTGLTQAGGGVFSVAVFASPQAALDAAVAANGGTVYFPPGDYTLAAPLTIPSGTFYPIRLTGAGQLYSGPASSNTQIFYGGAVAALIARDAHHVEVDHLNFFCTNASLARVLDFSATTPGTSYSFAPYVHDCTIETTTPTVSCIGIDLHDTQGAVVRRNEIAINSGTGVQGIPAGGLWSVRATIDENVFSSANAVGIKGPGQTWTVENNIVQSVAEFMTPAPVNRTDVLTVRGNWIGDFFVSGVTMIHTNASSLVSIGNTYANFATGGICILMDNSSGSVCSIGDRLEGAVGIAIGTGNYLTIETPEGHLPTTLYTGTPANTNVIKTIGGLVNITGALSLGLSGTYAGSLKLHSSTSGTATLAPPAGAIGTYTVTLPNTSGSLANGSNSLTMTNKAMDGATNTFTNIDASTLGGATFAAPGAIGGGTPSAGTFTTLTGVTGAINGTLTITNTQNAVSAVTLFNTSAGTGANPEYVANNGTANFKVGIRGTGQTAYGALTAGVGFNYCTTDLVIMADSGNKIVFAPGSSAEKARFSASGGLSIGTTVDGGAGSLHLAGHIATKAPVTFTGTSGTVGATDSSVIFNPSGAFTVTLPAASAAQSGHWLDVKSIAAQTIVSASSNVVPRAGGAAGTALLASGAGNWARLQCDGTNWIIMAGS